VHADTAFFLGETATMDFVAFTGASTCDLADS
jgi:hypothetical protein